MQGIEWEPVPLILAEHVREGVLKLALVRDGASMNGLEPRARAEAALQPDPDPARELAGVLAGAGQLDVQVGVRGAERQELEPPCDAQDRGGKQTPRGRRGSEDAVVLEAEHEVPAEWSAHEPPRRNPRHPRVIFVVRELQIFRDRLGSGPSGAGASRRKCQRFRIFPACVEASGASGNRSRPDPHPTPPSRQR
jgi:hypothetical protein